MAMKFGGMVVASVVAVCVCGLAAANGLPPPNAAPVYKKSAPKKHVKRAPAPRRQVQTASALSDPLPQPHAKLKQVAQPVLVNKGGPYGVGCDEMPLEVGDRVKTLENGSTVVEYRDGCVFPLGEYSILTVEEASPCQVGLAAVETVTPPPIAPLGLGAGPALAGVDWLPALLGAGLLAAALPSVDDNGDRDVSPQ